MSNSVKSEVLSWIKCFVVAFVFIVAMRVFILSPVLVNGESMMPTFEDGDKVIVNKLSKPMSTIDRFDVIVFEVPVGADYIKRVIGLPGDHVAYKDDTLYINGEPVEEPYLDLYKQQILGNGSLTQDFTLESLTGFSQIPDDHYFVLGDNRRISLDSRDSSVGLIPRKKIEGTVTICIYPWEHAGLIK